MQLLCGDCFELMERIPAGSVDFVCTDMPYGITDAEWDYKVDLQALWGELKRVVKPNAAFALFGAGKFSYELVFSNFKEFRYRYCWYKQNVAPTLFLNAKKRPLRISEDINVFYAKQPTYNPQRAVAEGKKPQPLPFLEIAKTNNAIYSKNLVHIRKANLDGKRYPTDVLTFRGERHGTLAAKHRSHPTQKSVEVLEFLIKTYTNDGEVVLDPFMGSGSCGVACIRTGRKFIGIEKNKEFFDCAQNWILQEEQRCSQNQNDAP